MVNIIFLLYYNTSFATDNKTQFIITADELKVDNKKKQISAHNNVVIKKDNYYVKSNYILYDKKTSTISSNQEIKIINYNLGNINAQKGYLTQDLSKINLQDVSLIFKNGSYITSTNIKKNKNNIFIKNANFSICPNDQILKNNKIDNKRIKYIELKSKKILINEKNNKISLKNTTVNIFNIPVLYIPYISTSIPSKKRKSGFLDVSYTYKKNLGSGVNIPYYFNIASNQDLTTSISYHPSNHHLIINNKYRHLSVKGNTNIELEIANNNKKNENNNIDSRRESNDVRFFLKSQGDYKITKNTGLIFDIDVVGDLFYQREYHDKIINYTTSKIDIFHVKESNYSYIKIIRIQDFLNRDRSLYLPIINSKIEKKGKYNITYSLLTNATSILKNQKFQYNRLSLIPDITIPYNFNGNLFSLKTKFKTDLYHVDNNKQNQVNYSYQLSGIWKLPLINHYKKNTMIIEPKLAITYGNEHREYSNNLNRDSAVFEITKSNLFVIDKFYGFDRNETGLRVDYGINYKLYNNIKQFNFYLGQNYRDKILNNDIILQGLNKGDNLSDIIGNINYKISNIELNYNFNLDSNDFKINFNKVNLDLDIYNILLSNSYIFFREGRNSFSNQREQVETKLLLNLTSKIDLGIDIVKDITSNRVINKQYIFNYDASCVRYKFSVSERNNINFLEKERSFNVQVTIKNF